MYKSPVYNGTVLLEHRGRGTIYGTAFIQNATGGMRKWAVNSGLQQCSQDGESNLSFPQRGRLPIAGHIWLPWATGGDRLSAAAVEDWLMGVLDPHTPDHSDQP